MNIDKKIEELRKEFNEKIEELKREYGIEKSKKFIPKERETYYYINQMFKVCFTRNEMTVTDIEFLKYNKVFKTKEEAQEYADYLKSRETYSYKFSKEEWKDASILKHVIYLDTINQDIFIESTSIQYYMNSIYFKSRGKAEEFIDKYKKQILKFEFGIEEE